MLVSSSQHPTFMTSSPSTWRGFPLHIQSRSPLEEPSPPSPASPPPPGSSSSLVLCTDEWTERFRAVHEKLKWRETKRKSDIKRSRVGAKAEDSSSAREELRRGVERALREADEAGLAFVDVE